MKYKARGLSIDLSEPVRDNAVETFPSGVDSGESGWEQTFDENAHSNTKLYHLLPDAINATQLNSGEWASPASFPTPVLD